MGETFICNEKEYDVDNISDKAKSVISSLQFVNTRLRELHNMQALLQRAKNSYVNSIKKEMLSSKAGLLLGND